MISPRDRSAAGYVIIGGATQTYQIGSNPAVGRAGLETLDVARPMPASVRSARSSLPATRRRWPGSMSSSRAKGEQRIYLRWRVAGKLGNAVDPLLASLARMTDATSSDRTPPSGAHS